MNYTRIFSRQVFRFGDQLILPDKISNHLRKVLRKKTGDIIQLFDGKGSFCLAEISSQEKKNLKVKVINSPDFSLRKGINIHLGQSLVKPDPWRFSIQKAAELGVVSISPLSTERTVVKIINKSKVSRKSRWESIAIGACQQCGENWLPEINEIQKLESWCKLVEIKKVKRKIVLNPSALTKFTDLSFNDSVAIAVGPEGDFTQNEIGFLERNGFISVSLGERILRAETAVVASLSAIRTMCGEF